MGRKGSEGRRKRGSRGLGRDQAESLMKCHFKWGCVRVPAPHGPVTSRGLRGVSAALHALPGLGIWRKDITNAP